MRRCVRAVRPSFLLVPLALAVQSFPLHADDAGLELEDLGFFGADIAAAHYGFQFCSQGGDSFGFEHILRQRPRAGASRPAASLFLLPAAYLAGFSLAVKCGSIAGASTTSRPFIFFLFLAR